MLMPTRWIAASVRPIARPAKPFGVNGWVTPRMVNQEQEGRHDLEHQGREAGCTRRRAPVPPSLLAQAPPVQPEAFPGQDQDKARAGADQRAEHLRDPVLNHFGRAHATGDEHAEADRGVDVTTRDRPDAVSHGDNGEAEGARDAEQVDRRRARSHPADDRRPAAEKHQGERANKFRKRFIHFSLLLICRPLTSRPRKPGRTKNGQAPGKAGQMPVRARAAVVAEVWGLGLTASGHLDRRFADFRIVPRLSACRGQHSQGRASPAASWGCGTNLAHDEFMTRLPLSGSFCSGLANHGDDSDDFFLEREVREAALDVEAIRTKIKEARDRGYEWRPAEASARERLAALSRAGGEHQLALPSASPPPPKRSESWLKVVK